MRAADGKSSLPRRGFLSGALLAGAASVAPPTARAAAAVRADERAAPSAIVFRSVERLVGSPVRYAYAAKAGPFVFLNGHESFDFDKGAVPEVAGAAGFPDYGRPPLRREADFLIGRMDSVLKELGTDLAHSVRLDQYYTDADAVRAYHLARFAYFGKYIPPSTSIITERCFGAHSNVATSLMAVLPDPQWKIEGVYPENAGISPLSGYAPAVTCNDFVFAAGQMAEPAAILDGAAGGGLHRRWGSPLPIRRQAESALNKLEATLKAANSSLANVVKAVVHVAGAENFSDFVDVWSERFRQSPAALTVAPAKGFASVEGIVEINLIALKNGATRKKEIVRVELPAMASFGPCLRAGEFVFPSGMMGLDRNGRVAGAEQGAAFPGLCLSGAAQADAIYEQAEAVCKAAGTTMRNAVRAHYWVSDLRDFPGVAMAWARRYGAAPHPFGCVATPPLPAPGATVMADFWIYAG